MKTMNLINFSHSKIMGFDWFQDLATAFIKVLGHPKASKQVFNISGAKYVTFDGLARACAKVKKVNHKPHNNTCRMGRSSATIFF